MWTDDTRPRLARQEEGTLAHRSGSLPQRVRQALLEPSANLRGATAPRIKGAPGAS